MFSASRISRDVSKSSVKSISGIPGWRAHVIYADRGVLVINKPSGLASQPGPLPKNQVRPDSVRPILERFQEGSHLPWPCHRLDKRTSGALLCARNPHHQVNMNAQFAAREVQRKYLAILRGGEKSFPEKEFNIRTLLEINDGQVSVVKGQWKGQEKDGIEEVDEEGRPKRTWAETGVKVLATSPDAPLTLVELEPKTGRRHQLRVHAAHIRAPILGDSRYASAVLPPQITNLLNKLKAQRRAEAEADALRKGKKLKHLRKRMDLEEQDINLFLHAAHVEITRYRSTGNHKRLRLGITAPLPGYFVNLCNLASLPLPEEYITGGVYVDGVKKEDGIVEDLDGKWRVPASKGPKLIEGSSNDPTSATKG